jgi:hypothetical protein
MLRHDVVGDSPADVLEHVRAQHGVEGLGLSLVALEELSRRVGGEPALPADGDGVGVVVNPHRVGPEVA